MTRVVRRDANHAAVVNALRACGCSVWDASRVGGGFPDLVVGRETEYGPVTYLLEVKDGALPPSRRQLNDAERKWHQDHRGQVAVVLSVDEALRACELT